MSIDGSGWVEERLRGSGVVAESNEWNWAGDYREREGEMGMVDQE
jgi:hypothetical protein